MPHSLEGESFRIEIVGTPVHESTRNKIRANKTTSKAGVSGFWQEIYCKLIEHFSGDEDCEILVDIKTRKMVALLEEVAKTMLERYKEKYPQLSEQDPFYYYINGKVDSKMLVNVAECYLQRVALLKCIFPEMPIRKHTHEADGRMALRKTLFQVLERRGVINHILEQLSANKRLWNAVFGELAHPPSSYNEENKRQRVEDEGPKPTSSTTVDQTFNITKEIWDCRDEMNIIKPRAAVSAIQRAFGKKSCKYIIDLLPCLNAMSTEFSLVLAVGHVFEENTSTTIAWEAIAPHAPITAIRRESGRGRGKGSGGGKPMAPALLVVGSDSMQAHHFLSRWSQESAPDRSLDGEVDRLEKLADPPRNVRVEEMSASRQEDEPEEVHTQAMELVGNGAIEPTTAEQRKRNRARSKYECPPALARLVEFGYISPNYSWAPQGTQWATIGSRFVLRAKGG